MEEVLASEDEEAPEGSVTATGVIEGKAKGSCAFIMPASGNFSGTVNQTSKIVPVNGEGSIPASRQRGR